MLYIDVPSGKLPFCCGKEPFFVGKSNISMVHFHKLKLPEGIENNMKHDTLQVVNGLRKKMLVFHLFG